MENKKILFISPQAQVINSGISKVTENYLLSLKNIGAVDFIFRFGKKFRFHNVSETHNNHKFKFFFTTIVQIIIKNYDYVFINHSNYLIFSFFKLFTRKTKFIVIGHGIEIWNLKSKFHKFLFKFLIYRIIAVSKFTKKKILSNLGIPNEKVIIISPKIDIKYFKKSLNKCRQANNKNYFKKYLLFIGRLDKSESYKGLDEIIDCSKYLKNIINLIVIGDGSDKERLLKKYKSNKNKNININFLGKVSDNEKFSLLKFSKASILCGYGEGFGISLLESLIAGKRIIASSIDATKELLLDDDFGVSINPNDLKSLASNIDKTYKSKIVIEKKFSKYVSEFDIKKLDKELSLILI